MTSQRSSRIPPREGISPMPGPRPLGLALSCPPGLAPPLVREIKSMGCSAEAVGPGHVRAGFCTEPWMWGISVTVHTRIATKVDMVLAEARGVDDTDALFDLAASVDWTTLLASEDRFAVHATVTRTPGFAHDKYAAQITKDAIVERFSAAGLARPSVDLTDPDLLVSLTLYEGIATLGLRLNARPLHERGEPPGDHEAPLKRNVAAGILATLGYDIAAARQGFLLDPCCGSGTFLVEALGIMYRSCPGRHVPFYGTTARLLGPGIEQRLNFFHRFEDIQPPNRDESTPWRPSLSSDPPQLIGADIDPRALARARDRLGEAVQLVELIHANIADLPDTILQVPLDAPLWLVANPPYGERMEDEALARDITEALIEGMEWAASQRSAPTAAAILSPLGEVDRMFRRPPIRAHRMRNGPIACTLWIWRNPGDPRWSRRAGSQSSK